MNEVEPLLREVESARLQERDWQGIDSLLRRIDAGDDVEDELTSLLFEARVRGRFSGPKANASLPPTKQTSALPIVGVACGGLLFGIGALLGGGVILVGVALLSLFVFGVAFAGSRVAHRGGGDASTEDTPPAVPAPAAIRELVATIRAT